MAIVLGTFVFDSDHTAVREAQEEVAGRDARAITITGMIAGESSVTAIEEQLDAILDAASAEDGLVPLSLREERLLYVRRESFEREVSPAGLVGSFTLKLSADDPFEVAADATQVAWAITDTGATLGVTTAGNVESLPVFEVFANDTVVSPTFSDGKHTVGYDGTLAAGDTLVLDGEKGTASLNGDDATPYVTGVFPRLSPEGTVLTYSDGAGSSHNATVTVSYKDRWW